MSQLQVALPTPNVKVNKRSKRQRLNRRLRKLLSPKNAIMVLYELRANVKYTIIPPTKATQIFRARAVLNGGTHEGKGGSLAIAKLEAAEHALKALLLDKVLKFSKDLEDARTGNNPGADDVAGDEGVDDGDELADVDDNDLAVGKDGLPWRLLASYALNSMLMEWSAEGASNDNNGEPVRKRNALKKLPDMATAKLRDPVMLLSQLMPGIKFSEAKRTGGAFLVEVVVHGTKYTGTGMNVKIAKKAAAKKVLTAVYHITYDD